jgi:hypothetical protein
MKRDPKSMMMVDTARAGTNLGTWLPYPAEDTRRENHTHTHTVRDRDKDGKSKHARDGSAEGMA